VWIWKGNSAALPHGVPKLQRTEEKAETRSWSGEDENGKITRGPEGNKTHARVHQGNRQTRSVRGKVIWVEQLIEAHKARREPRTNTSK